MSDDSLSKAARRFLEKYHLAVAVGLAFVLGMGAALLGFSRTDALLTVAAVVGAWIIWQVSRSWKDPGEWQRRIDREYRLEIDGDRISLLRHGALAARFEWRDVLEIQSVRHPGEFPPAHWKIITASGEYLLPDGGRYLQSFLSDFVYALPGYHEQQTVMVGGAGEAMSLWRKNDPYPKVPPDDDL